VTELLDTFIENRHLIQPNHTNNLDTAHGGNVMKWMDEIGAMSAMRVARESCVTAQMSSVDFERPIPRGDTCLIESYAYETGRTSIRVRLRASREAPETGERERTTEASFVFVAIDEDLRPTEVPDLTVESDRGEALRAEALAAEPGG